MKRYKVRIKFGPNENDWATYKDVIDVTAQRDFIWVKMEKKLVGFNFKDVEFFEQEVQNEH